MAIANRIIFFTLINGISGNIYQVLFNLYLKDLGYHNDIIGNVMSFNLWGSAVLGLIIGILADRIGRKRVLFIVQPLVIFFAIMRLFPSNLTLLYFFSFFFGGFNASIRLLTDVFLVESTSHGNRAKYFGINFGVNMLTGVLGNSIGGFLGDFFGFRKVMFFAMLLRSFALVPILNLKEKRNVKFKKVKLDDFQKKIFTFYIFSTASVGFGAGLFIHFGNVIFYDLFSMSATFIGFILAFAQLGTSIGSAFSHKIGKRFGAAKALMLSNITVPLLILMLAFVREPISFTTIYISRFTIMNMVNPIFNTLVLSYLPSNILAASTGLRNFANNASRAFASMLFSILATSNSGYTTIFLISSVFYFTNGILMFVFYKTIGGKDKKFYS
ncbi:MFS transporter [Thermosipho melanesiensis]|uniref:Major facilitator superfamily MFS_1 n=2 Tax=Thermosipho melanesiensis TaxID=46541 RepID=A6LMN9_THEM4|nr:MFS transporter [Thermosipho melanesiensis]ABR31190.1 major facilitator superfamily MFS_1 [Thermosipho melanesiensis BI429]APT74279.1 MFS transporter [Thermosipho melanesiensis]OOC36218.1 MFS transporter [Thermosipho melanesiensis]OOC37036.1 MFS transporter [Thermosipho melanesiensis]OOC37788.1 MFS transporter [Thermosipho melanesiensis]